MSISKSEFSAAIEAIGVSPYARSEGSPGSGCGPFSHQQSPSLAISQCVGAALLGMTAVPFDPYPANVKLGAQFEQHGPQLAVFQCNTTPVPPAMALPIENKRAHSID